jgi:hypothetical protein
VARFDFEGEGTGDLCFEEGDYIRLLGRVDSEWVKGELYGKVGIFPMTFVEMIEDLPAPTQDGMNEMISSEETKNTTGLQRGPVLIQSVFSFREMDGEESLSEVLSINTNC